MGRLQDEVWRAIRDHALWQPGDRVAVAVSGGLDSVVLLHLLKRTRGLHRGELSVVTVDHGTRAESSEDATFVEELSAAMDMPCTRATFALGSSASEADCRDARYEAFAGLDVERVALAHHADDQAETVLIRLIQGAGTAGQGGMAHRRDRYVRPLLGLRRAQLENYAADHGLTWREDASNRSPRFVRNRIRHEVLPLLEHIRPGATATLARSATLATDDARFIADEAERRVPFNHEGWSRHALVSAPRPVARAALRTRLSDCTQTHIDAVLAAAMRGSGVVVLSDGTRVIIASELVRIEPSTPGE